jgi:hypothetical protein
MPVFSDPSAPPPTVRRMTLRHLSAAVLLVGALTLAGCKVTGTEAAPAGSATAEPTVTATEDSGTGSETTEPTSSPSPSKTTHTTTTKTTNPTKKPTLSTSMSTGPRVVSFTIVQKPKCAEGTAVFRADPVPLIIGWKITGADSAALSVDDPTHTPGTYGPEGLSGTEEFTFTCAGAVGTVETHTYAIYTVGGGAQKSKTIKASAKVLDKGPNSPG